MAIGNERSAHRAKAGRRLLAAPSSYGDHFHPVFYFPVQMDLQAGRAAECVLSRERSQSSRQPGRRVVLLCAVTGCDALLALALSSGAVRPAMRVPLVRWSSPLAFQYYTSQAIATPADLPLNAPPRPAPRAASCQRHGSVPSVHL